MPEKILIVDDEHDIADLLEVYLRNENYVVYKYYSAKDALTCIENDEIDLAILDIMLPGINGFSLCQKIREKYTYPIIMLTAKGDVTDKVAGLDMGANDYMTKPFGTAELMARVRAALRVRMLTGEGNVSFGNVYRIDDLVIDCERRVVSIGDKEVKLTQTEFNILTLLAQHRGKMLTYSTIIRRIWGSMDEGSIKKLQVNMANIRKKLGIKPGDNRYFVNELGVGYRMLDE